jgi:general secretion pathway protein C
VPDLGPGELPQVSGKQPGEGPCTQPLRLIATMETNMPEYSWATIRDEEDGSVGPYWPGDRIRTGVYLVSVERSLVHVKNGGALEYIELGVEPPKPSAKPLQVAEKKEDAPPAAGAIPGAEDAIKCESENSCTVDRMFIDSLFANPAALTKQARVMPSIKDGETKGFKFYGIRPGSLPKLLGMKNGDLLTSVNGIELKSVDQVMGLLTKMRSASNLQVTSERKGESITKDITIQ